MNWKGMICSNRECKKPFSSMYPDGRCPTCGSLGEERSETFREKQERWDKENARDEALKEKIAQEVEGFDF